MPPTDSCAFPRLRHKPSPCEHETCTQRPGRHTACGPTGKNAVRVRRGLPGKRIVWDLPLVDGGGGGAHPQRTMLQDASSAGQLITQLGYTMLTHSTPCCKAQAAHTNSSRNWVAQCSRHPPPPKKGLLTMGSARNWSLPVF